MSRYDRYDVTDEQWEGLAQVVPLRSRNEWPSRVDHRTVPDDRETAEQRRMVVLRVQVFADAREVAEYLIAQIPVLLDLTGAETDVAKRILDFSQRCGLRAGQRNAPGRPERLSAVAGRHGGRGGCDGGRTPIVGRSAWRNGSPVGGVSTVRS